MRILSISRLAALAASALVLSALSTVPAASAQQVCMNTSNGNGGSIANYPYLFNNNSFGWSDDKSAPYQCLTLNYTSNSSGVYYDGFSSSWSWPQNSNQYDVKAYPSMVYGWQYGYTYSGLGLPSRIWNNTSVPTYQSGSLYSTGFQYEDVLIDSWLLDSATQTNNPNAEVEIFTTNDWNAYQSGVNDSSKYGYITLDSVYYVVTPGYNGHTVYNFVPNDSSSSVKVSANLEEFVNALCYDYGALSNSLYLAGTQIGVEAYYGVGGVTFNPASISAN